MHWTLKGMEQALLQVIAGLSRPFRRQPAAFALSCCSREAHIFNSMATLDNKILSQKSSSSIPQPHRCALVLYSSLKVTCPKTLTSPGLTYSMLTECIVVERCPPTHPIKAECSTDTSTKTIPCMRASDPSPSRPFRSFVTRTSRQMRR